MFGWKVPDGHGVAVAAPVVPTKNPGRARKQSVAPCDGWYVPTWHAVAKGEPSSDTNDPAGARRQAVCPNSGWKAPGEQNVTLVAPAVATKLPGTARSQGSSPVEEKVPGLQVCAKAAPEDRRSATENGMARSAGPRDEAAPRAASRRLARAFKHL
jgi:hypothetical protein